MANVPSVDDLTAALAAALAAAGAAHHDDQQNRPAAAPDDDWAGFYAAFVLGRVGEFATPTRLTAWLQQAPSSERCSSTAAAHVLSQL